MAIKFSDIEPEEEKRLVGLPTIRPALDLDEAKKSFAGYLEEIDTMLITAKDLIVNNDKTNVDATVLGTSAMTLYKKIIARKEATQPYIEAKDFVDKFEAFIIMLTEKLYSTTKKKETIVSTTKAKIAQYTSVLESERRKQQELANRSTEELQGKLNEEAKKTGTIAPKVVPQIIPKKESTVRTETGAAYTKKRWTFKVNDPEWHIKLIQKLGLLVTVDLNDFTLTKVNEIYSITKELLDLAPFLIPNETKIRRAIIDGRKHIGSLGDEGTAIHIYEEVDTSFRTT